MTAPAGRKPGGTEFGLSPSTPGAPQNGAPGHRPLSAFFAPPAFPVALLSFCWIPRHPPLKYPPRPIRTHAGVVQW